MSELHVLVAERTAESGGSTGLFLVAWGVGATAMGLTLTTDFRGAAGRLAAMAAEQRHRPRRRREPSPRSRRRMLRVMGGAFALSGPPTLIAGVVHMAHHGTAGILQGRPGGISLPFVVAMMLVVGFGMVQQWSPRGMLRRAWTTGGPLRRTAAVVLTFSIAGFAATAALGYDTLNVLFWLAGAPAGVALLLSPESERADGPTEGGGPAKDGGPAEGGGIYR
ncbi:hypothetical protein ACIPSA_16435 [Streptomyces sp. NPDC086549]|uniref:hypothetical protein n=1 Tax=Streptomyces sp. NPDC086549 TaxID=3365752 RepID=UPI00380E068F